MHRGAARGRIGLYDFRRVGYRGPISAIRPSLASRLEADGLLDPSGPPLRFRIRDLTTDNQALPLIAFGLLRRLERIDVDALLGLDFLSNFEEIRFNTKTLQLTLIR